MRKFKIFMKKEPLVLPVVLIILGLIAGYLLAKIFYSLLPEVIINWNENYIKEITNIKTEGMELFRYIIFDLLKEAAIYFLLCMTILGIPYYIYVILKKSFQVSFLISNFIHVYNSKGVFMAFCHYFPQMLLYIPASYLCIKYGYNLYADIQSGKVKPSFKNNSLLKKYGKNIIIIICCFLIGALLEAFVGTNLWFWSVDVIQR